MAGDVIAGGGSRKFLSGVVDRRAGAGSAIFEDGPLNSVAIPDRMAGAGGGSFRSVSMQWRQAPRPPSSMFAAEDDGDGYGKLPWRRLEGGARANGLERACIQLRLAAAHKDFQAVRPDLAVRQDGE